MSDARAIIEKLGACWVDEWDEYSDLADELVRLPPRAAWSRLVAEHQSDAWWLLWKLEPALCERLAEPWRRFALRAAAWAMLAVPDGQTHAEALIQAADADVWDWAVARDAARAARAAARDAAGDAAWAAGTAAWAAGAARNAAWAAWAAGDAAWAAGIAAGAARAAAGDAVHVAVGDSIGSELLAAADEVVEAWGKWLGGLS